MAVCRLAELFSQGPPAAPAGVGGRFAVEHGIGSIFPCQGGRRPRPAPGRARPTARGLAPGVGDVLLRTMFVPGNRPTAGDADRHRDEPAGAGEGLFACDIVRARTWAAKAGGPCAGSAQIRAMKDNFDEKLTAALHDVPVPEGLADRLLERLKTKNSGRSTRTVPVRRSSRFVPTLSLAATAAVLLIAVWLGMPRGEGISESFVLDEAIRSFDVGVDEPGPLLAEKPAPAGYPFSTAVLQLRGTRWRPLEAFLGRRGVVYDLPGPAGTTASLYVVDAEGLDGFGTAPALHPYTTAGCCASSWQEGGMLYVLVVQGDPATFRAYPNIPHGPVA